VVECRKVLSEKLSNLLLFNKTNRPTRFQIYSGTNLYMFWLVRVPIIRS